MGQILGLGGLVERFVGVFEVGHSFLLGLRLLLG